MKHLYIYLDKTNGFVRKLWLMAAFLLCSLQINAQCRPGSVTFQSQQEVEAFAAQYPNCTRISGDLILTSNVTSLSPLQKIVTIDGDFNINGATLSKLDGLSSLKNIRGSLLANSSYVENFSGLSSLTSIGGNLNVQNNSRLTSFSGLSSLTTIGGGLLTNFSKMSNFNGLSSLATIGGDLNLENSKLNTFTGLSSLTSIGGNINTRSTTELQNFEGLSSLKNIGGMFLLESSSTTNFAGLSSLTTIGGGLHLLGNSQITNFDGLNSLTSIGGAFWIEGNGQLNNLNGLSSLKTVGGRFYINSNPNLQSVNFSALSTIGADIRILGNQNLKSLETLTSLTRATGDLYINSNANLTDISGLKNLDPTKITNLSINGNTKLAVCNNAFVCNYLQGSGYRAIFYNATGCEDINTVIASCVPACEVPADITSSNIISNKAKISWTSTGSAFDLEWGEVGFTQGTGTLQNGVSATNYTITGLTESTSYDVYVRQNCTAVQSDWVKHTFNTLSVCPSGDITLLSQNDVNNFAAMYPDCTQLAGSLKLGDYATSNNISNISSLGNITSIGGHLRVLRTQLTDINSFSSVTTINGELDLSFNPELTDISGVQNINSTGITFLWIEKNPNLSVCNVTPVCTYLQSSGSRLIQGNKTGCQDVSTIIASCIPACEVPANIVSSNIISNKAKISWTSTGSAFDLEWGDEGFTQGTGTVQNGVSATNYMITGLTESTSYDVYIRQNCTTNQSDWVKYTFSTISVCPAGNIILSSQEEVDDFGAMYPNCTQTEGSLILLYDITDLSPLSKLQSIGTHLGIYETQLTNLNGLSSLTSINGGIEIGSNFELEDISGLKNINSGIINLSILANLKLSVCNISSICNYLQTSGYRVIEENATGCEDENAVKSACTATLSTSDINKKGVMVYPNPFTDVINLSDINNIQSVTVNDISGKLIKTIKPTREINFSDTASGVYIINVKFKDGDVKSFKVIKK